MVLNRIKMMLCALVLMTGCDSLVTFTPPVERLGHVDIAPCIAYTWGDARGTNYVTQCPWGMDAINGPQGVYPVDKRAKNLMCRINADLQLTCEKLKSGIVILTVPQIWED